MKGAPGGGMDAILFSVKRAHLGGERFGRRWLKRYGLTPARFDLMNVASRGAKQSEIVRRLGVVRSAVCEMLAVLEELGLVVRRRARDARTWMVRLTERGREVFERAYRELIDSGDVAVALDRVIAYGEPEIDVCQKRYELAQECVVIGRAFGSRTRGEDLYWWDVEDFYGWLTYPGEPEGDVPFVTG